MTLDVRVGVAMFLIAAAISLPPIPQAILLAVAWLLPHLVPAIFMPATPQRRAAWARFQPFVVLFVFLSIVVQGFFGPEPDLHLPLIDLSIEGIEAGLQISLRAVLLLTGIVVALMPLKPLELADRLTRVRLPIGLPVAILLSLQLVEDLPETVRRIKQAQRSRGLRVDGSLFTRMAALRYLITPVVMRTLEGSLERSVALQLRGLLQPLPPAPAPVTAGRFGAFLGALAVLLLVTWTLQWTGLLPSIV